MGKYDQGYRKSQEVTEKLGKKGRPIKYTEIVKHLKLRLQMSTYKRYKLYLQAKGISVQEDLENYVKKTLNIL